MRLSHNRTFNCGHRRFRPAGRGKGKRREEKEEKRKRRTGTTLRSSRSVKILLDRWSRRKKAIEERKFYAPTGRVWLKTSTRPKGMKRENRYEKESSLFPFFSLCPSLPVGRREAGQEGLRPFSFFPLFPRTSEVADECRCSGMLASVSP